MSELNKTDTTPLLKLASTPLVEAKIHCVCTAKLKRGELPACEEEGKELDEKENRRATDPTGEALQAVISKNAAIK